MVEITESRLANVRSAERLITAAHGTERHYIADRTTPASNRCACGSPSW
jgi:hypothetical protein